MMYLNLSTFLLLPVCFSFLVLGQKSEICVAYESSYHIEKGCECLVFESYGGSQGIFTSPNFPLKYPAMTSCILYTFIGDANETVEISFEHFHLPPPSLDRCSDFLRLFLDLERPEMSNEMRSNFELCGDLSSVDKFYFSTNRSLIIEFHSENERTSSFSGFKAHYRFIDKSKFDMRRGAQRWSSGCVYEFRSTALPSKSGFFYSPEFPHPPPSSCRYFFHGTPDEQVILNFTSIQLSSSSLKCTSEFRFLDRQTTQFGGLITIRDGIFDSSKVLRRFCGSLKAPDEAVVKSSEENIFVDLTTDLHASFQGFAANFRFEKRKPGNRSPTTTSQVVTLNQFNKSMLALEQLAHNLPNSANSENVLMKHLLSSTNISNCNYTISGSSAEQGEISFPGFERFSNQTCRIVLIGQQHQQIQLVFLDFDLKQNASLQHRVPQDCTDSDSLTISMTTSSTPTDEYGVYCGDSKPPNIMITTGTLVLVVKSATHHHLGYFRGFRAKFSFTNDFGINSGDQIVSGECSFSYNSSKAQNGSFHSPNFPGLYPRNLVCHYKFYARPHERIETIFSYLDVDGFLPLWLLWT